MSNTSGINPKGHRVVLLPKEIEEKSAGGIIIHTAASKDREAMAQMKGTVVAVGATCWRDMAGPPWCKPGDTVMFGKYAGVTWEGKDGVMYRIVNDLDIVATLD